MGEGGRAAIGTTEYDGQIVVGPGFGRHEPARVPVVQDRLVEAVRPGEHPREVVLIRGLVGPQTAGRGVLFDRLLEAAEFGLGLRQALARPGIVRALLHGFALQREVAAIGAFAPRRPDAAGHGNHRAPRQRLPPDPAVRTQHTGGDDRGEGQIRPVFDHPLDRAGRQRRGRRNAEAPGSGEAERGFSPQGESGAGDQRQDDGGKREHIARPLHPERAVLEDQRMGPQRELKIAVDRFELYKWIRAPRHAHAETDGAAAVAARAEHPRGE